MAEQVTIRKLISQMIYYTLESSSAVLAVYCSFCNQSRTFGYSSEDEIIASWTDERKSAIACPTCVIEKNIPVWRKVHRKWDIPRQAQFRTESCAIGARNPLKGCDDRSLFGRMSQRELVESYPHRFERDSQH